MSANVRALDLPCLAKKAAIALFILPALLFAQNETRRAAQNSNNQQMESKKGNFTSFSVPHNDLGVAAKFNKGVRHPELGRMPYNADYAGCVEVLEKRKVDERFFVNEKNPTEFYLQKGLSALHYKKDGQWLTIDPRISDIGNGIFEASQQFDAVGFDVNRSLSYIKTPDGTVTFNDWKLYGSDADGAEQLLATANWSSYTAGDDGIYVNEIFPGIDAQMRVYRGSVKTDFVVKKLNFSNYVNLLFKDEFKTSISTSLQFAGEAVSAKRAVSPVYLMNGKNPVLEIGEALAYPQNGTKDQKILPEYFLEGNTLVTSVPVEWIQKYVGRTNVIIDPLVSSSNTLAQGSITGSQYNGTCNFTNSCNQNLSVNTPANATITDILWSFTYIAQGACWLEDGACRFTTGACVSPSQANFYWFCNLSQPGTCTGTNISIMTDLGPCLPAPSCAPQAINFTMQFFRGCWGANNCGNACIGANSPWIMTLEGHTVEFTTPGSEISLSSSTICFGQTVFASSTGTQYGVPAHTVNWSFNSSGTPSLGTGTSLSVGFPAPGTYTLYSIVTDGCAQTATASAVITVNPTPTITATSAPNPICLGQSSTLTAAGGTTYTWSANAGGGSGTTANVSPGAGTTVYTVTGTSLGCSNTGTVSVTVNPLPTVTASITPTTICAGQSATLTASGAITYTWSANEGGSSNNPTSVTPGASDTYTVTGTDNNGCVNTGQVSITVTPSPTLVVTPASATICAGAATTCTVTGATTYTWSANAGSVNTSTLSVNPSTTDTYTVTGDNGGCQSTAIFSVQVDPLPSLTVTANPASICAGQTATLTASGATTYTWSANSGGGNGNPITVSPSGTTTYTLAGTQNGCSDSTTVTVTFGAQPVLSVSATDTTICNGQNTTITVSGAASYTWAPSGSGGSSTVNPNANTTYTVIGDNGGCSDTTMFTVNVNPTPTVTAVSSPSVICAGQNDTLTASGAVGYSWSSNAGSATTSTVVVTPGSTDTYTVTGTDGNGCSSTAMVTVTVNALPTITVNSSTICAGQQTATLTANGATTYTWSTAQNGNTITVNPSSNTVYTVNGTDANGCMNVSTATVLVNQPPTVSVNSGTICAGSSTTLTANGALIYIWAPPTGLSATTGSVVTANPGTSTSYTVMGMDMSGCTDSAVTVVNVNTLPTVTANTSPSTLCAGSTATLTSSGATTYTWSANANSSNNDSTSVTPGATDTYTVTGTDANGCTNTAMVTVTINPLPTIAAVNSQTVCGGNNVSSVLFGAGAGVVVNWINTNTSIGTGASGSGNINGYPAPFVSSQQIGVITATPTDTASGCVGSSQTFTIVVNPTPTVTGGTLDSALCGMPTGGVSGLTVSNGTPSYTYQWYSGGLPVSGGNTLNLSNQPIGGTYSFVVTDANSCMAGAGPFTVPGTPAVVASFNATPTTGTATLTVGFTNNSVGATTYNWNFGNSSGSILQNPPNAVYSNGGMYIVTLVATNGSCSSTATDTIYVDQMIDIEFPNVFSPNGDNINDEFMFITSGITDLSCDIFNRWGQKVKTLSGPTDKWDGKLDNGNMASEGTYFYTVIATSYDGKTHNKHGPLTIVK